MTSHRTTAGSSASISSARRADNDIRALPDMADVGLKVRVHGNFQLVAGMAVGGPAEESLSIMLHDCIESIDGASVKDLTTSEVQSLLAGPEGSQVCLSLLRGGRSAAARGAHAQPTQHRVTLTRAPPGSRLHRPMPSSRASCVEAAPAAGADTVSTQTSFRSPVPQPSPAAPLAPSSNAPPDVGRVRLSFPYQPSPRACSDQDRPAFEARPRITGAASSGVDCGGGGGGAEGVLGRQGVQGVQGAQGGHTQQQMQPLARQGSFDSPPASPRSVGITPLPLYPLFPRSRSSSSSGASET
jgi:hypothetical protein